MTERSRSRATTLTLAAGTIISVVFFVVSFVLGLVDPAASATADALGLVALVALLATPAAGLIVTAAELWDIERHAAQLALLVLTILGSATVIALAGLR